MNSEIHERENFEETPKILQELQSKQYFKDVEYVPDGQPSATLSPNILGQKRAK